MTIVLFSTSENINCMMQLMKFGTYCMHIKSSKDSDELANLHSLSKLESLSLSSLHKKETQMKVQAKIYDTLTVPSKV